MGEDLLFEDFINQCDEWMNSVQYEFVYPKAVSAQAYRYYKSKSNPKGPTIAIDFNLGNPKVEIREFSYDIKSAGINKISYLDPNIGNIISRLNSLVN